MDAKDDSTELQLRPNQSNERKALLQIKMRWRSFADLTRMVESVDTIRAVGLPEFSMNADRL